MALPSELGFLPFFAGEIPGFSVEECCPPEPRERYIIGVFGMA